MDLGAQSRQSKRMSDKPAGHPALSALAILAGLVLLASAGYVALKQHGVQEQAYCNAQMDHVAQECCLRVGGRIEAETRRCIFSPDKLKVKQACNEAGFTEPSFVERCEEVRDADGNRTGFVAR
jgi:hypothetical protein